MHMRPCLTFEQYFNRAVTQVLIGKFDSCKWRESPKSGLVPLLKALESTANILPLFMMCRNRGSDRPYRLRQRCRKGLYLDRCGYNL